MEKNKEFNISICSYNVLWKIMKNNNSPLINLLGKKKVNELKSNILKNIYFVKNYFNPYFYCFQESENFLDISNLFEYSKYKYHVGYSEPEHMLTIWKSDIFQLEFAINGEFELGRPFCIFIFKDLRFNIHFILINVHSGHIKNTLKSIFTPIQKYIELNKKIILKFDIKRVIICGDFNRDINLQIKLDSDKYNLIVNSNKFNFIPHLTKNKTCCNLKGYDYDKNYDQVIDSYREPILTYQLNFEPWYIPESSDHLMILSIVKNYLDN